MTEVTPEPTVEEGREFAREALRADHVYGRTVDKCVTPGMYWNGYVVGEASKSGKQVHVVLVVGPAFRGGRQ